MKEIKWEAKNGKEIIVKHVTEKENNADHNFTVKCDEIIVTLGGEFVNVLEINEDSLKIRLQSGQVGTMMVPENVIQLFKEVESRSNGQGS